MYDYQEDRSPEENVAMALYAIANELSALGLRDAATPLGAMELLSKEIRDGFEKLSFTLETAIEAWLSQ